MVQTAIGAKEQFSSYEGTHFVVSFMQNEFFIQNEEIGVEMRVFVSARTWTNVQINYPDGFIDRYRIPKDSVLNISISNTYYNQVPEVIKKSGIEIITDNPVIVYAFCSQSFSSDSYACIPTSNWGTEYVVVSMPNDYYDPIDPPPTNRDSIIQFTPRPSEFLIIAYHNNTKVTFKPKVETAGGKQPNQYYTITLDKYETYLVQSRNYPRGFGDLSGTLIKSDKPIGVLSGHTRTAILQQVPKGKDSKDHIVEMLQPINAWGRLYFSVPFGTSPHGDFFKVINIEPNTKLKVYQSPYPVEYTFTDSLQVKEFQSINTPTIWQSDKPIQIAQFMQRLGTDKEDKDYDPSMVMLPPREQFIHHVLAATPRGVFYRPNQYTKHFVAIIAENSALDSLFINKKLLDTISPIRKQTIVNTDLHWAIIELKPGTHDIYSPTGKFSGILFGTGEYDSYAMVLGSGLLKPDLEDNLGPIAIVDTNCFVITGLIRDFPSENSSGINFAKVNDTLTYNIDWLLYNPQPGDTVIIFRATIIDINKPARFLIEFWDKKGNKNRYVYQYEPYKLDYPLQLDFGVISWTDSLCVPIYIKNNSDKPIKLNSIDLPTDKRLKILFNLTTPYVLQPNEGFNGEICFYPNKSLENLKDNFYFNFECGITKRIAILAEVVAPDIEVSGWDFGNVYLLDSALGKISIKNTGNIPLRIDSLYYYLNESAFEYDKSIKYPFWLNPDSTFYVQVLFKPMRRDDYLENVRFSNHLKIQNKAIITGKGVAPLIQNIAVNFGNRRIGTQNDTTVNLTNDGNIQSLISFQKFLYYDEEDFNYKVLKSFNQTLGELGIAPLNFKYNPNDTVSYQLTAEFQCDWKPHPPIIVDIRGRGTLPVVKTNNYDFGDVQIFTEATANPILLTNTGNEALSIDSIYVIENTNSAFNIDLSKEINQKLSIYGTKSWLIRFAPKNLGSHRLVLGVLNDALPNYKRKVDTIIVLGNSVAPPQIVAKVDIIGKDRSVCLDDTVFVEFINLEDFAVNLDSINLSISPNKLQFKILEDYENKLPIKLQAKEKYSIPIWFRFKSDEQAIIFAEGIFNLNNKYTQSLLKKPRISEWTIAKIDNMEVLPSDTLNIIINGQINDPIDTPVKFNLEIETQEKIIKLLENAPKLIINSKGKIIEVQFSAIQTQDKIELKWQDIPIALNIGDRWSISLPFLGLLDIAGKTSFNVKLSATDCFDTLKTTSVVVLKEVCMNPMRPIIIVDDQPEMKIYPNPANNFIKIELNLKKNSYIYISIFDIFGKEIVIFENSILSKGNYLLIFVVENMTNGKYFLKTKINEQIEMNIINIIR